MKPQLINAEMAAGLPGTMKLLLSETGGFLSAENICTTTAVSTAKNCFRYAFFFFFF